MQEREGQERTPAWRLWLARYLRNNPDEKQRIAEELAMRQETLNRWMKNSVSPHKSSLLRLIQTIPSEYQKEFRSLLQVEFPILQGTQDQDSEIFTEQSKEIPPAFYKRVLSAYNSCARSLTYWTISSLVVQQIISHLDADHSARMIITIVRCTPPAPNKAVRSLYYYPNDIIAPYPLSPRAYYPLLLGLESPISFCLHDHNPSILLEEPYHALPYQAQQALITRIELHGRIAGLTITTTTQKNVFNTTKRNTIVDFHTLLALAFENEHTYSSDEIALSSLPPQHIQEELERKQPFHKRLQTTKLLYPNENTANLEHKALQSLEEDLLNLPKET